MRVMDNQDNEKIKPQPEVQEKENKNEEIYNEEIPTISNLDFKYISTCKEADKINTEKMFLQKIIALLYVLIANLFLHNHFSHSTFC